jgi:hypothetical protein
MRYSFSDLESFVVMDSGLAPEPVIGPRFARTRWLADPAHKGEGKRLFTHYLAVSPPSIGRSAPVMNEDASDSR